MRKNLNFNYLKLQPTIFSPVWLPIIRTNYYKVHLLDANNQLITIEQFNALTETEPSQKYYTQLQSAMENYILRHKDERELDSLAPNPCLHSLLTNNHHGLAGKIYEALITKYTENHFSAHIKWSKAGHLYSKEDIKNTANTVKEY